MENNNKARREAAVLVFVVFLLGVLLGGVGNHLWGQRVSGGQPISRSMATRDQLIAQCTREVQLTPDQQQQLGAIIDNTRARWLALFQPLDAQKEEIRQEGRARIRAMLTPEQLPKFDDFMRRADEQRKKDAAAAAAAVAGH